MLQLRKHSNTFKRNKCDIQNNVQTFEQWLFAMRFIEKSKLLTSIKQLKGQTNITSPSTLAHLPFQRLTYLERQKERQLLESRKNTSTVLESGVC